MWTKVKTIQDKKIVLKKTSITSAEAHLLDLKTDGEQNSSTFEIIWGFFTQ